MSKEDVIVKRPVKRLVTKVPKSKNVVLSKKKVLIDFKSVLIKLEQEKGVKLTLGGLAEQSGFNRMSITKMRKHAPAVVGMLYSFLKEYDLDFFDLVKEVVEHE